MRIYVFMSGHETYFLAEQKRILSSPSQFGFESSETISVSLSGI